MEVVLSSSLLLIEAFLTLRITYLTGVVVEWLFAEDLSVLHRRALSTLELLELVHT